MDIQPPFAEKHKASPGEDIQKFVDICLPAIALVSELVRGRELHLNRDALATLFADVRAWWI